MPAVADDFTFQHRPPKVGTSHVIGGYLAMATKFKTPVWIHDGGLNFRAIATAEEAHAYLAAWRGSRAAIYDHAVKKKKNTMAGKRDVVYARDTFRKFAHSERVLAEAEPT